ncbi:GNAT family N-acetyltransferase [Halobacteriales archaeon Cl-PHB]
MPGPTFQAGDRVSLHTVEEDDLEVIARARSDPEVRVPLAIDSPTNSDGIEEFFEETVSDDEDGVHLLACVDEEVVGAVYFIDIDNAAGAADLAYWILPEHQGEGYGSAALSLLLEYGFLELRLNRVQADCLETNEASRGLLESLGFTQEGRFREREFLDGDYVDVLRYGLLIDEWRGE